MKTALDSSVILDVITGDERHADSSEEAIRHAMAHGQILIGETVLAEITPAFQGEAVESFLEDWNIVYCPSEKKAAIHAGKLFSNYLKRGGTKRRVVADFLVGSHALYHADQLLARDRGYYRDYFKDLKVVTP